MKNILLCMTVTAIAAACSGAADPSPEPMPPTQDAGTDALPFLCGAGKCSDKPDVQDCIRCTEAARTKTECNDCFY